MTKRNESTESLSFLRSLGITLSRSQSSTSILVDVEIAMTRHCMSLGFTFSLSLSPHKPGHLTIHSAAFDLSFIALSFSSQSSFAIPTLNKQCLSLAAPNAQPQAILSANSLSTYKTTTRCKEIGWWVRDQVACTRAFGVSRMEHLKMRWVNFNYGIL